jgi:hypothetical protein
MKGITKEAGLRLVIISTIILLTVFLIPFQSFGAAKYWIGGSDWWNYGNNWNPSGQPQNGDNVYLIQSDATNREVWYQNTTYPSAVLGFLRIDATGTGTMTFSQSKDQREGL